jgi:hypothetical protein
MSNSSLTHRERLQTAMETIDKIKIELREEQIPFFSDNEISYYLAKNGNDFRATLYEMLLIKAENNTISVSGWNTQDTSAYFRRLASKYRPFLSGQLSEK